MSKQSSEDGATSNVAPTKRNPTKKKELNNVSADGPKRSSGLQVKKMSALGPSPAMEGSSVPLEMFHPGRNTSATDVSFVSYSIGENSLDFGGRMDKLAELELQQLWNTLWNGVHDTELLRHAENNPRARWNPYRPIRGGPQMREQVLNSQLVEFKDVIPTDAIYISGTRLTNGPTAFDPPTLSEAMESLRRPSERSSHSSHPTEYKYEIVPSDQLRSELFVQGASLPIHDAPHSPEEACGVEEVLVAAGEPPVEVFALEKDSTKAAKGEATDTELDQAGEPTTVAPGPEEGIAPETVHQEEMTTLLFQYMWRKVVLPFYVKTEGTRCATPPADTSLAVESLSPSPQDTKNVAPFHSHRARCSSAFIAQTTEDAPVTSLALTRGGQLMRRPTTSGPVRSSLTGPGDALALPPPPHDGGSAAPSAATTKEAAKLLERLNREHANGDVPQKGKRHKKKRHHSSKKLMEEDVIDADTEASSPGRQGTHLLQRHFSPPSRGPNSVPASGSRSANAATTRKGTNHSRNATGDFGRAVSSSVGFSSELESSTSPPNATQNSQRNLSSSSRQASASRELTPKQLQLSRNTSDLYSGTGAALSPKDTDEAGAAPQMVNTLYTSEARIRNSSAPQVASSLTEPPAAANKLSTSTPAGRNQLRGSDYATLQKAIAVSAKWREKNAEQVAQLYGVPAKTRKHTVSSKPSRFGSPNGGASSPSDTVAMSGESESNGTASALEPLRGGSTHARSRNSSNVSKSTGEKSPQTMYFKSNKSSSTKRSVATTAHRAGSPSFIRHRGLQPMAQPDETRTKSTAPFANGALTEVNWKRRGSSPQGRRLEPLTTGEPGLH